MYDEICKEYDLNDKIRSIGGQRVRYDFKGRISEIGNSRISYDFNGNVSSDNQELTGTLLNLYNTIKENN